MKTIVGRLFAGILCASLFCPKFASPQTSPSVFLPFETGNQVIFNGRFDRSILGFFAFESTPTPLAKGGRSFSRYSNDASAAVDQVPIPSGSVSVAYTFDPKLETFVRWERPYAPALSLNANTDGRGVFTVGVSYSYINYQSFNGQDRDRVVIPLSSGFTDVAGRPVVDEAFFQFKLRQSIFSVALSYGLLDNLDIGVLIPIFHQSFRGSLIDRLFVQNPDGSLQAANPSIEAGTQVFRVDSRLPSLRRIDLDAYRVPAGDQAIRGFFFEQDGDGIGDLILRSRVLFGSAGDLDFGGAINLSVPTGDERNLMGVGSVRVDPRVLVSTANDHFGGHINWGVHIDAEDKDRDRYDYSIGGEWLVMPWLTLLLDQVGRIDFSGIDRVQKYEIVPGVKANPYGQIIVGFNAIVALNHEGLTSEFTPNATIEVSTVF